jgi:hypothetical protein
MPFVEQKKRDRPRGVWLVARIAGVNIPTNKRVVIALQYIHGIGPKFAKDITEKVGIPGRAPRQRADRRRGDPDP